MGGVAPRSLPPPAAAARSVLPSGAVRADVPLGVAAVDVCTDGPPEGIRVAEVPAESVPFQPGMLTAQGGERRCGEPAPLVFRIGVRLLDPAKPAATTDLVVDGEQLLAVKISRSLTPAGTLG